MTSKNSFSSLLREDIKAKLWLVLISSVVMFFNFTLVVATQAQRLAEYVKEGSYTRKEVIEILADNVGGQNRTIIFMILMLACVSALSQFGYLHHKEQVDFYHSLPIRRQKRFWVRLVNGLGIYIIPYLVFCLSGLAISTAYGFGDIEIVKAAFLGGICNTIGYILCYLTGILAVCLTGNMFAGLCGMATLFGYGYLVTVLVTWLMNKYSLSYMGSYGAIQGLGNVLSPLGAYIKLSDMIQKEENCLLWGLGCVIVAIVLTVIVLQVFVKRTSESAGKSMAFEKSKGVIKGFIMTGTVVGGTLFFGEFGYSATLVWEIIGFAISFIVSQMVIQTVFELDIKAMKSGLVSAIISGIIGVLVFVGFDIGGEMYDNYQIDWKQMEYAAVNFDYPINFSYDESNYDIETEKYVTREETTFEYMKISDKELIKKFTQSCIESQKQTKKEKYKIGYVEPYTFVSLKYTLSDGSNVYRSYQIAYDVLKDYALQFMDNQEYRQGSKKMFHIDSKKITQIKYYDEMSGYSYVEKYLEMDAQEREHLIETYKEEYMNASVEQLNTQAPITSFVLVAKDKYRNDFDVATAVVYPFFEKTIAILQEKGMKYAEVAELDVKEITISCGVLENQVMEKDLVLTYTDAEKIQELKNYISLGDFSYFTSFDQNYSVRNECSASLKIGDKNGENVTLDAYFVKSVPEWLKEDLKDKQIEQEVEVEDNK